MKTYYFIGQILEVPHGISDNIFYFIVEKIDELSGQPTKMRLLIKEEIEELRLNKSNTTDVRVLK